MKTTPNPIFYHFTKHNKNRFPETMVLILIFTVLVFLCQVSYPQAPGNKYKSQLFLKGTNVTDQFYLIMEDPANDILWFKSGENYYKYEKDTLYAFVKEDDILVKYTNESILDKPSNLEKYLISIFNDDRYIIDNKSNIWIKEPSALQKLVGTSFERFDINTKFIPDINAITEDSYGNIWLSTRRFGLVKISEGKYYYFNKDSALLGDNVYLTYIDSMENIWFFTAKGVNIYDGKSFIHYSEDTAKIIHRITSIIEPDDSTIWLSSFKGHVSCYDGEAWHAGHTKILYFAHPANEGSGAFILNREDI